VPIAPGAGARVDARARPRARTRPRPRPRHRPSANLGSRVKTHGSSAGRRSDRSRGDDLEPERGLGARAKAGATREIEHHSDRQDAWVLNAVLGGDGPVVTPTHIRQGRALW